MKLFVSAISSLFLCVVTYPACVHGGSPRAAALEEDLTTGSRSLSSTTYDGWKRVGSEIDGVKGSESGNGVSLNSDGSIVAVGSPRGGGSPPSQQGKGIVKVYGRRPNGKSWFQLGLEIEGEAEDEKSGESVSLSAIGKRVAIGAPSNDEIDLNQGQVRVYDYVGQSVNGEWIQYGQDINGDASNGIFGEKVHLSADGMRLIVGAPDNKIILVRNYARVFADIDGAWVQIGQDIDDATVDGAGNAIAISANGERVAVGEVFELVDSTWIQVGQDIGGENGGYEWEFCDVDLNDDGTMIIVGDPYASPDNGFWNGQARVFQEVVGTWVQVGGDMNGENAFDYFGGSVGITDDGSRVAIVAAQNDGGGNNSGHLRVFDLVLFNWVQNFDVDGEAGDLISIVAVSADGSTVAYGAPENRGEGIVFGSGSADYDYYDYDYDDEIYNGGQVLVFEQCTSSPCCEDVEGFDEGSGKDCAWVAQKPESRCPLCGTNNNCAEDYCRQTCGTC